MAAKKTQIKLYKIDTNLFPGKTVTTIPAEIIRRANDGLKGKKLFIEQSKKDDFVVPRGFTFNVYHALKDGKPGWVDAWTDILEDSAAMMTEKNSMSSYIVFITHSTNLYALTGGLGNSTINSFVENFFGIDVIDRLLTSTQDKGIGEASKSGITGNVKTESRTFYELTDGLSQDSFETFFRQLKSKIDVAVAKEYFEDFYPKKDYRSFFQGGNFFLIRKSILVSDIFELINSVERVFANRQSSGHNKLIPIGSVNSVRIDHVRHLNEALFKELFDNQNNPNALDNYYLAPKAIPEGEVDGSSFAIEERANHIDDEDISEEMPQVSEYIDVLLNIGGNRKVFANILDFRGAFDSYKIYWRHTDQDAFKPFDVFPSLNGVLELNGKSYLRFEGSWYEMRNNFKEIINNEFTALIGNANKVVNTPAYLSAWNGGTEDDYNYSYLDNNVVMVTHRVMKRDNAVSHMDKFIEYSDLIHLDQGVPKMIHVKEKCNGEMRVAAAQVLMCAQKLNQENKAEFYREYYQKIMAQAPTNAQNNKITEDNFVALACSDQLKIGLLLSDNRVIQDDAALSLCGKFYFVKMFKDMDNLKFGDRFFVTNVQV